jgi:hypothetical protein
MNSREVAKLTGYEEVTIRKYAPLLGVSYTGEGRRKTYAWDRSDVERCLTTIKGTDGRRDRRGETASAIAPDRIFSSYSYFPYFISNFSNT